MENTELTPQQRENIQNHLIRRIGRMDDAALLKFELATRHPVEKPAPELKIEVEEAAGPSPEPSVVNRRQAITYGVTGMLALLAASTGIGWGKSLRDNEELRAEGEMLRNQGEETRADLQGRLDDVRKKFDQLKDDDFDAAVRYALGEMNTELDELNQLNADLDVKKEASVQTIDSYQTDLLPKAQKSVAELKAMTDWMQELKSDPYLDEAMDVFLHMLETKELKSYFDFFKAYQLQVPAMRAYIENIPKFFDVNQNTVANLNPWLDAESGIDAALLKPLEDDVFRAFDASSRQVKSVQRLSEEKLTIVIEQFLEKRDQFYRALGET